METAAIISTPPAVNRTLHFLDKDGYCGELEAFIHEIRPEWSKYQTKHQVLDGGNINQIVKCWPEPETDVPEVVDCDALIVRIFGPNAGAVLDLETYIPTMQALHRFACCAEVVCRFNNGVVYKFTPGDIIHPSNYGTKHIRELVARKLAKFHSVKPNVVLPPEHRLEKIPKFLSGVKRSLQNLPEDITTLQRDESPVFCERGQLEREFAFVRDILIRLNEPVVMSHGDCWWTNIIYNKDLDDVNFIDCDFSGYNYRAWDIAYFTSFCRIRIDPPLFHCCELTDQEEEDFIQVYVKAFQDLNQEIVAIASLEDSINSIIGDSRLVKMAISLYLTCALYGMSSEDRKLDFIWFGNQVAKRYLSQKEEYIRNHRNHGENT